MAELLEEQVGKLLRQKQMKLTLAESCTGGLVGHRITNIPGSSDYYMGSITAYAYEAKERLLGVSHETLIQFGRSAVKQRWKWLTACAWPYRPIFRSTTA